jgi:outer membrane protein assembly factor BamB/DNA-directed RNA polymerase subunit RPC12/RpoP
MSPTQLESFKCPDCAAPLEVEAGIRELTCTYCGHLIRVRHAPTVPRPVVLADPPASTSTDAPLPPAQVRAGLFFMLVFLGGVALAVYLLATREHMQWVTHTEGPFAVKVDDDTVEDLVGHHRLFHGKDETGSSTSDYVGAFDGGTHKLIWRAGPFGKPDAIHFGVSGKRVLVTDDRHNARLFDLASGKPTGSVALSDEAKRVCPSAGGFFVESVDGKGRFVDADAHARDQAAPADCVWDERCERSPGQFRQRSRCPQEVPDAPDFIGEGAVREGSALVELGRHRPGTQRPVIRCVDAQTLALRWTRDLATVDASTVRNEEPKTFALKGGVVYVSYRLEKGSRLIAITVADGRTLWDVLVPHSTEGGSAADTIVLSDTRIYLPHWTWLDVFDRETGASLGTIGRW